MHAHVVPSRHYGNSSTTNQVLKQVVYEGLGSALTGSIALYFLGSVEPVLGSFKLASLLVITAAVSFMLFLVEMGFSSQDKTWHQKLVPSGGPLPSIFALYVVYWLVIPVCRPCAYGILGNYFSEKAPIYLLGAQLFFFGGWNSILPSIVGILCSVAWVSDICGVQHIRVPLLKTLINWLKGMDDLYLTRGIFLLSSVSICVRSRPCLRICVLSITVTALLCVWVGDLFGRMAPMLL